MVCRKALESLFNGFRRDGSICLFSSEISTYATFTVLTVLESDINLRRPFNISGV